MAQVIDLYEIYFIMTHIYHFVQYYLFMYIITILVYMKKALDHVKLIKSIF